ncbi:MAG: hypothetical protein DBX55_02550 [Verrucomicrobia bacterium]|nr:MAG: hypothetical protein DBX55_02550 [Verrucomicrobiota bacterium]
MRQAAAYFFKVSQIAPTLSIIIIGIKCERQNPISAPAREIGIWKAKYNRKTLGYVRKLRRI